MKIANIQIQSTVSILQQKASGGGGDDSNRTLFVGNRKFKIRTFHDQFSSQIYSILSLFFFFFLLLLVSYNVTEEDMRESFGQYKSLFDPPTPSCLLHALLYNLL